RGLPAVEAGTGAVGPPLPLAQVEVEAIEAAAQDQVHHRDGEVVGALALDADQADPDRRLRCAGLVDEEDLGLSGGARGRGELTGGDVLAAPAFESGV